jgi:hypothetical protein
LATENLKFLHVGYAALPPVSKRRGHFAGQASYLFNLDQLQNLLDKIGSNRDKHSINAQAEDFLSKDQAHAALF